jgi:hypothetical protein
MKLPNEKPSAEAIRFREKRGLGQRPDHRKCSFANGSENSVARRRNIKAIDSSMDVLAASSLPYGMAKNAVFHVRG